MNEIVIGAIYVAVLMCVLVFAVRHLWLSFVQYSDEINEDHKQRRIEIERRSRALKSRGQVDGGEGSNAE